MPSPWGPGSAYPSAVRAPGAHSAVSRSPSPTAVHSYKTMQPGMDRVMEFYETARVDGLIKREETPKTMTEYYQGRSDFLSYRHINFGPRVKKLVLNSAESNPRPVVVRACWARGQSARPLWWAEVTPGWLKP